MTDIGELVVRIKADATQLQQEIAKTTGVVKQSSEQMESALGGLKEQFKELIPTLTIAAVVEFGHRALEAASHIGDMANRIGFAAGSLSAFNTPLRQSGSSVDEFAASVNRMNNLIGEAAKGTNQEAVKAFDALGLSVRKLQQLSPEDQFFQIAEALGKIDNQSQFTNAGMAIFGRSFASIAPLIKEADGNLKSFIEHQKEQGNALNDEEIQKVKEYEDKWVAFYDRLVIKTTEAILKLDEFTEAAKRANDADKMNLFGTGPREGTRGTISYQRPGTIVTDKSDPFGPFPRDQVAKTAAGDNADLLRPKDSALKEYIANLKQETDAIGQNEKALFVARAEIEAAAKAKEDWNNHLRSSKDLLPDEKAKIDDLAGSYYDLKKAQEENARVAKMMQDALSDSLADIAVNFKSLQDTATSAIQAIAKEIIKAKITDPLSKSIVGALPSFSLSGIGNFFGGFFADGGDPPVGMPSIVGENGPEMFVPKQAGTVIPNNKIGGTTVIVQQAINMSPGLPETVYAAVSQAAPQIAAQAHASVFQAIQNGGVESRVVGRRS